MLKGPHAKFRDHPALCFSAYLTRERKPKSDTVKSKIIYFGRSCFIFKLTITGFHVFTTGTEKIFNFPSINLIHPFEI